MNTEHACLMYKHTIKLICESMIVYATLIDTTLVAISEYGNE